MQQSNSNYPKQSEYPDWHYQPLRLLKNEIDNPLEVVKAFFSGYTLPQVRKHFKEMLEDAMCNVDVCSINYLTLYDSIEKLIEAVWLIKEDRTATSRSILSLAVKEEKIQPLIQLLAASINPEYIFLLSTVTSTTDLLIVVPDNNSKSFSHYGTLIEAVGYGIHNFSFSLHTCSSFRQHIEEGHPFWLSCCTEEKLVYAKVTTPLPQPLSVKREALVKRMRADFFSGMEKSSVLLQSAGAGRLEDNNAVTSFLLHQSAELALRALILSLAGTEVKEHSIAVLKKHLRRCAPDVCHLFPASTEEEKTLLSLFDSAYRRGRYDNSFSPTKEQIGIFFKKVEQLHESADKTFSEILRSIISNSSGEEILTPM